MCVGVFVCVVLQGVKQQQLQLRKKNTNFVY